MKRCKLRTGFSLIELLVVIAIISILAAVALPAYRAYAVRVNVASALVLLEDQAKQVLKYYNTKGSFPDYFNTKVYIPSNSSGPIEYIYAWKGCTPAYSGDCMQVVAVLRAGVIPAPDGLTPSVTPGTGNDLIMVLFGNINGVTKMYCGSDARTAMVLPSKYLPTGCIANLYDATSFPAGIP